MGDSHEQPGDLFRRWSGFHGRIRVVFTVSAVVVAAGIARWACDRKATEESRDRCAPAFFAVGSRCCRSAIGHNGLCGGGHGACVAPFVMRGGGCDAPDVQVPISARSTAVGSADWEAEGKIAARTVATSAFRMDAYEATVGRFECPGCPPRFARERAIGDLARAAFGVTRQEASAYCALRGGRLPTENEWISAASGPTGRRYPWGDTGAVCRRGAWGLLAGPCAHGAEGPDTVGVHPDGASADGIFDLAGNVAEWVAADPNDPTKGVARGGSWKSQLATELRTWARLEVDPASRDDRVGVRCVFEVDSSPL